MMMAAAGGGLFVGLLIGCMIGIWGAKRKVKAHYTELCDELTRMQKTARAKLYDDDPNLNAHLRKMNNALNQTYKAAEALEDQIRVIERKTEGGREIAASTQYVARMISDFRGEPIPPEFEPPSPRIVARKANAPKAE